MTTVVIGGGENSIAQDKHITDMYVMSTCAITIKTGALIDLQSVLQEILIYEDMFSPSITGSIRIQDMAGGHEKFILTGGEKITLRISRADGKEVIITRNDLVVYEISKMKVDNQNSVSYELRFTTEAAIKSHKKRIFKSFGTERNLTNIIKKIYADISNVDRLFINAPTSFGAVTQNAFVCPGYNPIEAIQFLAKRACVNGQYYVFFERVNTSVVVGQLYNHYFLNVKDLKAYFNNLSIPKLKVKPTTSYITGVSEADLQIKSYQIQQNFNHMTAMTQGYYNSNIKTIDLLTRAVNNKKVNYTKRGVEQLDDLYKNRYMDSFNTFNQYDATQQPGERLIVAPKGDIISNKAEWILQDLYGAITNSAIRLIIEIAGGNNKIGVGNVVDVDIPSIANKVVSQTSSQIVSDAVYSGKYMVTAVKHIITRTSYIKRLEVSRGTFKFDIDQLIALS
jgi:hypothetical protein